MNAEDFDPAFLAEPIPGDSPTGIDLREDYSSGNPYHTIRDERDQAASIEKYATDLSEAAGARDHWRVVRDMAIDALREQTRDFRIAAYLIEAWVRLEGFAGLRCGFIVVKELANHWWDRVYPLPDEDGVATTVSPIQSLNGEVLAGPIRQIQFTEGSSVGPFAFWQYKNAADQSLKGNADESADVTLAKIERAANESSPRFLQQILNDAEGCMTAFQEMGAVLDEKYGIDSPSVGFIRETLEECLTVLRNITKDRLPQGGAAADGNGAAATGGGQMVSGGATMAVGSERLASREDAFRALLTIADFFERTEPQSLVPAQLRKVVKWGRMSPGELFGELLEDRELREKIFKLVGIPIPQSD